MTDGRVHRGMTRRAFVQGLAMMGLAGAGALLTSCAPAAAPAAQPTSKPAAPAAAATTAPAAKPTDAPKPAETAKLAEAAKPAADAKPAAGTPAAAAAQPVATTVGSTAPALAAGGVELKLITSNGSSGVVLSRAADMLAKRTNGKIVVKQDVVPFDGLLPKELAQFISKTPTYDIVAFTSGQLGAVWQYLTPLDDKIKAAKLDLDKMLGPKASKSVTFDTGIIALPWALAAPVFFYRKDALDAAGLGVPKSREEYRATAGKLAKKGTDPSNQVYGTSFYAKVPQWTLETFSNFFFRGGGRFLTDDLSAVHPVLKDAFTADTIDYLKAVVDDGVTPNPVDWTADDNALAFQQQKMMMTYMANGYAGALTDPSKSQVVDKVAYSAAMFDKPQGPEAATTFGNTWNLAIDKNSKNQDAAWELVKLCTSDMEAAKDMAVNGKNATTILSLLDDPEVLKALPISVAVKEILGGPGWIDFFPVPQYAELVKIVHEEIQAVYLGRQKGAEAAQHLYARFDDTLKRG